VEVAEFEAAEVAEATEVAEEEGAEEPEAAGEEVWDATEV
jgi:hypothetical protein